MEFGLGHKPGRPFRIPLPGRILRAGEQQGGEVDLPEIRFRDSGFVLTAPEVGAQGGGVVGQKCCGTLRIDLTACGAAPLAQKFGHAAPVQGGAGATILYIM